MSDGGIPISGKNGADRFLTWASTGIAVVYVGRVLYLAHRQGHFFGDDLHTFWLAHSHSFGWFVGTPIDVHLVPLHRLVSYLLAKVAPMNFSVALGILAGTHLVGVVFLHRALERVRESRANVWLTAAYSCNIGLVPLFFWWTAGLHRLPYVALSILAVYFYLGYRKTRALGQGVGVVLCTAAALGFYEKAVLLPLYLAAIELAMWRETPRDVRRRGLTLTAALLPVTAAFLWLWWATTDPELHAVNLSPAFHLRFVAAGLELLARSLLGFWLNGASVSRVLALGLFLSTFAYAMRRAPRSLAAGLAALVVIAANLGLVAAASAKQGGLGLALVFVGRYYFELVFLVVLFVGIAASTPPAPAPARSPRARSPRARWLASVGAVAVLAALAANAARSFESMMAEFPRLDVVHDYAVNVATSLGLIPEAEKTPLHIAESNIPTALVPRGTFPRRASQYLTLMGLDVVVEKTASLRVDSSGTIVRVHPP